MSNNIENTRKAYTAFAEGDIATVMDLISPDCIWHVGGRSQLAGDYIGHEQILGYFAQLHELTDGTFAVRLDDVAELPATGQVIALVTTTGTRNGRSATVRMVDLARLDDQGRVAECWWFSEDQYAVDELFGPAQIVLPAQAGAPVVA